MTVLPGVTIGPESTHGFHPNGFDADGLTAAAYNLLIGQPGLDLGEFAGLLGCTTDSARTVLDRLTDLGLLFRCGSGHDSLVALSPLTAMHRLITRERDILEQRRRFLGETVKTYSSILSSYGVGAGGNGEQDDSEFLPDGAALYTRLQDLAGAATSEVVSFRTFAAGERASVAVSRSLDLELLARGVRVRALYPDAVAFDEAALEHARAAGRAGTDVRLAAELPMSMILYDGRTAVVPRSARWLADGALVIRQPAVVSLLSSLFEARWVPGRAPAPVSAADDSGSSDDSDDSDDSGSSGSSDDSDGCTAMERAVVQLLTAGAKDDAVARQLGTSVRTVRRVVSGLMDRAGAASRFALGVHAARRGWL